MKRQLSSSFHLAEIESDLSICYTTAPTAVQRQLAKKLDPSTENPLSVIYLSIYQPMSKPVPCPKACPSCLLLPPGALCIAVVTQRREMVQRDRLRKTYNSLYVFWYNIPGLYSWCCLSYLVQHSLGKQLYLR